ncbi:MAG: hypothetical protein WBL92_05360 [Methanothrix sp.]
MNLAVVAQKTSTVQNALTLPAGGQILPGPSDLLLSATFSNPAPGYCLIPGNQLSRPFIIPRTSARKEWSAQGHLPRYDHWYSGHRALEGHVRGWCRQKLLARRGTRREQLTLITEGRIPGDLVRLLMEIEGVKRVTVY